MPKQPAPSTLTHTPTPEQIEQAMFYFDMSDNQWDSLDRSTRHKLVRCVNEWEGLIAALREAARWMTIPSDDSLDEEYRDAVELVTSTIEKASH